MKNRERHAAILSAAVELAGDVGLYNVTRSLTATKSNCADGLVSKYFGSIVHLRTAIVMKAVETQNLPIIAEALAARNPIAKNAPEWLKRRAVESLL